MIITSIYQYLGTMAKESSLQQSAAAGIDDYRKDLGEWPRSWMARSQNLGARSQRNVSVETLVFQVIPDGVPILYHNDSEEHERSFASACREFRRFLEGHPSPASAKRQAEITTYRLIPRRGPSKEMWAQRRWGRTPCRKTAVLAYFPVNA